MKRSNVPRASFHYTFSPDNILQIIDEDKGKSVTNDIDYVLEQVSQEENRPLTGCKVIYRDSAGNWDGVELTPAGGFHRFYSVHETDVEKALAIVRAME